MATLNFARSYSLYVHLRVCRFSKKDIAARGAPTAGDPNIIGVREKHTANVLAPANFAGLRERRGAPGTTLTAS